MVRISASSTAFLIFASLLVTPSAQTHPGRTDASGCHNNRSTGEYHCHNGRGGSSGGSYTSPSSPVPSIPLDSPSNVIQLPSSGSGQAIQVVSVGDGDTIRVRKGNQTITVRLGCIDAPEITQRPWGERARYRLGQFLPVGQTVSLREIDRDQYGRTVAEIYKNNQSVNLQMVREGYAVVYRQYLNGCSTTREQYIQSETQAKQGRLAFWSQSNPVMPWDFRRSQISN